MKMEPIEGSETSAIYYIQYTAKV